MHEDWIVCAFVSLGEDQLSIGECVNPCLLMSQWNGRPAPQSGAEPGAMNSGSLNTSAMVPLAALMKSPPTKSTSSSFMCE